ncbi:DUF805 domain-containing protein [Algivirga pacifica]|uniref:DUF805 domain-containing protein n=1 Tax=Algivirga pacifica TaxID=1162670 RepID=A0ABP9DAW2_9BACT
MKYYLKALQNYAVFSGRATRSEYWYYVLFNLIFSFIVGFIGGFIGVEALGAIYSLAVILPSLAVAVRRVHDTGKSGWFVLVPIYGLILMFTEGEAGDNKYGVDPKNPEAERVLI